jgi:nucleoside-diphosphate-sugar epimerase
MDEHAGDVFNIGSNTEISIGDLFHSIAGILKSDAVITTDAARLRPENSEVQRLHCDNRKLSEATGFKPCVPIEEGLRRTCEWFSEERNLRRYKGDLYNV